MPTAAGDDDVGGDLISLYDVVLPSSGKLPVLDHFHFRFPPSWILAKNI